MSKPNLSNDLIALYERARQQQRCFIGIVDIGGGDCSTMFNGSAAELASMIMTIFEDFPECRECLEVLLENFPAK